MATDVADWTQAVNVTGGSVAITGTATVSIVGTPTVQFAAGQTVGITGTVTVTISSGTVTISSGTVSINGVPTINITQASGLAMFGPNLMPGGTGGPFTNSWFNGGNATVTFNATGELKVVITANGRALAQSLTAGAAIPVVPGLKYHFEASFKPTTTSRGATVNLFGYAADKATLTVNFSGSAAVSCPLNQYTLVTFDYVVLDGTYFIVPFVFAGEDVGAGQGLAGDSWLLGHFTMAQSGAVSVAGTVKVAGAVSPNPNTTLVAAAVSGQAVITPADPTIFFPGAIVQLTSIAGNPGFVGVVKSVNPGGTVTFTANLTNSFVVGDAAIVLPEDLVSNRKRAYDFTGFANPAQGNQALITVAAVSGQRIILNHLSAEIVNTNAAGATGVGWDVRDGGQAGSVLWISISGMQGITGDKDKFSEADLGIPNSINNAMTCRSQQGITNATLSMSVGGYTSITEPI